MGKRFFVLLLLASPHILTAQTKTFWSPKQAMTLKNITSVRVSPDGRKAVYAVREAIMSGNRSEYVNQLFITSIRNPDSAIRISRGDKDNVNPRWSNNGRHIGFISNRDGKNNLYILPVDGGESERLTNVKTAVADFKWSPDSKSICYTMSDSASPAEEKLKTAKDDWFFMDDSVKPARLYVIRLNEKDSTGQLRMLKVSKDNRHITSFNWSPDGNWIAYSHAASPVYNDVYFGDLSMVNVNTGEIKVIAKSDAGEADPLFSTDGKSIAFVARNKGGVWGGKSLIKVFEIATNKTVTLAETPSLEPQLIGWSSDGKWVFASEPYQTISRIYKLSTDGKNAAPFSTSNNEVITLADINATGSHIAMLIQSTSRPADAYVTTTTEMKPVRITNINPGIEKNPVPKTEVITWKSFDGKEMQGLLTYPVNYEKGKSYPLFLNIHGGPAGVFIQNFIAGNNDLYPIAAFAENGVFVLRPNPRGSGGYGMDFRLANQRDWGGADYKDLMTGVDHLIAQGMVDSTKMGVGGFSYGGYMTSWIVGHTNRFKAASIGAPVVDLTSFNGTTDIQDFLPSYMKKQPWEDWEIANNLSPLRYVQNINTPVLLQHGDADLRVPFSQGTMLYQAIKKRGVPIRFLVMPRQPHGTTEPKMTLKVAETNLEWMLHYLQGKPKSF